MNQCAKFEMQVLSYIVNTERVNLIISSACYVIIEIILLSYYAQTNNSYDYGGNYKIFLNLSIAGSVFLMLSFMGLIALNFYKHIYIIYFLAAFMPFAVFLILIGMGMASSTQYNQIGYNAPVAFWFIQLMLLILAYLNLYKLKGNSVEERSATYSDNQNQAPVPNQPNQTNNSFQIVKQQDPQVQG